MKSNIKKTAVEKRIEHGFSRIHIVMFSIALAYVVSYELFLVLIPAENYMYYALGKIFLGVTQAVVTGYIFYFFTVTLPNRLKKRAVKPIVAYYKNQLADEVNHLTGILLNENKWKEKCNDDLKKSYNEFSRNRKIWTEQVKGFFADDERNVHYNPSTLFCIDLLTHRIVDTIDKLISMSNYLDSDSLEKICWLSESKLLLRLHICDGAYKSSSTASTNGDTYLDSFFNEELSIRMFSEDPTDKTIFIVKARELIKIMEG